MLPDESSSSSFSSSSSISLNFEDENDDEDEDEIEMITQNGISKRALRAPELMEVAWPLTLPSPRAVASKRPTGRGEGPRVMGNATSTCFVDACTISGVDRS